MKLRLIIPVVLLAAGGSVLWFARSATAQTTANGPYYAVPSWDQTLPVASRFIVLSNMNSEAVLDRETGLVWQRTPPGGISTRPVAQLRCVGATIGGRQGWRLPHVDELMSLSDPANVSPSAAHLPTGHPFNLEFTSTTFWTSDALPPEGGAVGFAVSFATTTGGATVFGAGFSSLSATWCVRGIGGVGAQ